MCTVTYFHKGDGYILSSNRDESPLRKQAIKPNLKIINNRTAIMPVDGKELGTWIFTETGGVSFCLLNGAFEKHIRILPYRKSRGKIVLEYFNFHTITDFANTINLVGIEPFTLIMVNLKRKLYQLVWDGNHKHFSELKSDENHIWSSSTLYNAELHKQRKSIFHKHKFNKSDDVLKFHLIGKNENTELPIFIKRSKVETISTCQIMCNKKSSSFQYFDHFTNEKSILNINN